MAEIIKNPTTGRIMEVNPGKVARSIALVIDGDSKNKPSLSLESSKQIGQRLIASLSRLTNDFGSENPEIEIACRDTSSTMGINSALTKLLNPYNGSGERVKKMLIDFAEQNGLTLKVDVVRNYVGGPTTGVRLLMVKKQ